MPRRKRPTAPNERVRKIRRTDNNNTEEEEEEEEEEDNDNTLVISDSENDGEEEDCSVTQRTVRHLDRDKKAHVQDMTEDEMLALALRLSKQEANCACQREQVEDDDMRKAIAESLQVSGSQASGTSYRRTRSAAKPHRDQDAAPAPVRCKLSFQGRNETDGVSAEDLSQDGDRLPPMSDLSPRSLSQPSSRSPTFPPVPSATSQESRTDRLVKREMNDAALQNDPVPDRSPVLLRHCSVRINPNLLNVSKPLGNVSPTAHSSLSVSSPEKSQNSSSPSKSPVFPKTDSKRCTNSTRGKFRDCTSSGGFTDALCKPEETLREPASHKRRVGDEAPKLESSSSVDTSSLNDFTSHMVLHLSDDDDDESDDKIIPPSPVFRQDPASRAGQSNLSPTQPCSSSPAAGDAQHSEHTASLSQVQSAGSSAAPTAERRDIRAVSYYWGVPFCPKGESPDEYTRVILAQLEVYEKSLKEAQRQLLHKADWGQPVFPCPAEKPHGRRLKRHRAPRLLEEDEEEDEEQIGEEKKGKKPAERTERAEAQPSSEEVAENSQQETYVVVSSPETQDELGQKSPSRFKQQESTNTTKRSSRRKAASQELSENTLKQLESDEHGEEDQSGSFDVESAVCPETQMTEDHTPELMVTSPAQLQADADVMEVDEASVPVADAEERMEQERPAEEPSWRESVSSQVECPMCARLFPLGEIEMHAAYCNGTVEDQDEQENLSQDQGSSRRRSVRKTAVEDYQRFEKSEQQEKCYVCNKFISTKDYSHHVDRCLQQKQTSATNQGNGLLSALNRTESMHPDDCEAGPSNSTITNNRNHTNSSVTPDDSVESLNYYISSSPIKSFTPISEITDCLIDFRQQTSNRTGQRLGRKRKFKR